MGTVTVSEQRARKWMWGLLAALAGLQLYFVRELVAALILFGAVFAALAVLALAVYFLQEAGERGMAGVEAGLRGLWRRARPAVALVWEISRRPFRRPRSEPAR